MHIQTNFNLTETSQTEQPTNVERTKNTGVIPFVVAKAVADKKIDLLLYAEASGNATYAEALKKTKYADNPIDLTQYEDPLLRQRLAEFFYELISKARHSFVSFRGCYCLGYEQLLQNKNVQSSKNLQDYITSINLAKRTGDNVYPDRTFANAFSKFVSIQDGIYNTFDSDIWDMSRFQISKERVDEACKVNELHFEKITNSNNKELIKEYIEYLLEVTNLSIKTVSNKLRYIRIAVNCVDIPIADWDSSELNVFLDSIDLTTSLGKSIFYDTRVFASYLSARGKLTKGNPFLQNDTRVSNEYHFKSTAPSADIIMQLFSKLHKVANKIVVLVFLIMYCTGARISNVAVLRRDCLVKRGNKCFVKEYISKMRKYVENPIPPLLYDLISDYRRHLPKDADYLFPSPRKENSPIVTSSLRRMINREFDKLHIIGADGTPYHFTPHSLRHLMAHRMLDANIPLQFIQMQLHHGVADMTFVYVEYTNDRKVRLLKEFVDRSGLDAVMEVPVALSDAEVDAEMLRRAVYAQMLPNGMCSRPVRLGKCPHANKCLRCSSFRTSEEYLPIHMQQKTKLERYLKVATENGLEQQAAECKEDLAAIEEIIDKLTRKEGK